MASSSKKSQSCKFRLLRSTYCYMSHQDKPSAGLAAAVLKLELLSHAARRRRQFDSDSETEPKLSELPPQGKLASRNTSAPEWSALHD